MTENAHNVCTIMMAMVPKIANTAYKSALGSLPISQKTRTNVLANNVWTNEAMYGDPCISWERPTVLPKTANSFSLPKAKLYRAAQLWNAMPQANEPEINRIWKTITARSPRRTRVGVKNISDPVAGFCASLTDSAAPVPAMAIHETNV